MFYPEKQHTELQQHLTQLSESDFIVVCYCAAWCRTCAAFESAMQALALKHPSYTFVWVDVEKNEALLVDEDIEDFPTILLQTKNGTHFYGPIPPVTEHIERLIQQAAQMPIATEYPSFEHLVITAAQ